MPYTKKEVGAMLEPTWLYADVGNDLRKNPLKSLVETMEKYNCRNAVVHPGDVQELYDKYGCRKIVSVIDFPYGRNGEICKLHEINHVVEYIRGADVVINLWALQRGDLRTIQNEFATVRTATRRYSKDAEIKAICQMPFIWQYQRGFIQPLIAALVKCGVNVIKDWTTINNFCKPVKIDVETRLEYVNHLRELIDKHSLPLIIKVAGKVDADNVVSFKKTGVDIFGVSTHKIPDVFEALLHM
jgi:deoxyribose-phosphate aldolase